MFVVLALNSWLWCTQMNKLLKSTASLKRREFVELMQSRLLLLMRERNLTATEVALICDLPRSTISSIFSKSLERAPSVITISKISFGLKVPMDYFVNVDHIYGDPKRIHIDSARFITPSEESILTMTAALCNPSAYGDIYYCPTEIPLFFQSYKILIRRFGIARKNAESIEKSFASLNPGRLSGLMLIDSHILQKMIRREGVYETLSSLDVVDFNKKILDFEARLSKNARMAVCDFASENVNAFLSLSGRHLITEFNGGWLYTESKGLVDFLVSKVTEVANRSQSIKEFLSRN
jgi:transcriptional regulator with XRE-family HTH domain